ncbi:MAG TPA: carboxymuconolactone decarboxylase family protein [Xanthomonadales bacterium]|nr:carboxymuconolactone decarboxylase family protein [Xanthomonadales bacterium]
MPYIQPIDRSAATGATATTLDAIQKKLGTLPNMFRTLASSPAALQAYVQLAGAAATGRFDAARRERIALAVGEANACGYCVAAHGALGALAGLDDAQIESARAARAADPRETAVLELARRIVDDRGHVDTASLDAFKAAGFDDADILEVLVNVVLNVFTNWTNHLARTEIDFPARAKLAA